MFSNLIFLILALLIISFSNDANGSFLPFSPFSSFAISMGLYFILLALIVFQNRLLKKKTKNTLHLLVNLELIVFLLIYQFILGGQRVFSGFPYFENIQFISVFFSLLLYFVGLLVFHFSYATSRYVPSPLTSTIQQIRLMTPFAIPFLLFTLFFDLFFILPESLRLFFMQNFLLWFFISLCFMGLIMIFLPPLTISIWQCRPMENQALKTRLEALCEKAHFKHGGMLDWTILNQSLTAAIVGIIPRWRYVLFTKKLQHQLSPESLEAILAHEIGHSYRKHLLIYPIIILGMAACTGLFSLFFSEAMSTWATHQTQLHPDVFPVISPFLFFFPYALIILLYFRYVFGLFSRLFERQADLHGYELGLPPEHMIKALDDVAIATGFTHLAPNWHHYSLQQRIDFLKLAAQDPSAISKHHQRVKRSLLIYLFMLAVAGWILLGSLFPEHPFFEKTNSWVSQISKKISSLIL